MAFGTKKSDETVLDPKHATILSEGCLFEGNISGSGSIRIDGEVRGDIQMKQSVVLGSKGLVSGSVKAKEMIVFGRIVGNVTAAIVEIRAGGSITGELIADQMTMELGGKHNGSVSMKETTAPTITPAK